MDLYYDLSSLVVAAQTDQSEKRLVAGQMGKITINDGTSCTQAGEPFYNAQMYPNGVNSTYGKYSKANAVPQNVAGNYC